MIWFSLRDACTNQNVKFLTASCPETTHWRQVLLGNFALKMDSAILTKYWQTSSPQFGINKNKLRILVPCSPEDGYQVIRIYCLHVPSKVWRWYFPLRCHWWPSAWLCGFIHFVNQLMQAEQVSTCIHQVKVFATVIEVSCGFCHSFRVRDD